MNKIEYDRENKKLTVAGLEDNVYYKDNPEYFLTLKELVEACPKSFFKKLGARGRAKQIKANRIPKFKYLKDWIDSRLRLLAVQDFKYSVSTKVNWILSGRTDFPKCENENCPNAGKPFGMRRNVSCIDGYPKHCCAKCVNSDSAVRKKINSTNIKKYGAANYAKTGEYLEKTRRTKLEKYGDPNYVNPEKMKQTKLRKYGDEGYSNWRKGVRTKMEKYGKAGGINPEKRKKTCLERYGAEHYSKTDEYKNKYRLTSLSVYGVEHPFQDESVKTKIKTTTFSNYGVSCALQSDDVKCRGKRTKLEKYGNEHFVNGELAKETNLKKYGAENVFASEYGKNKIRETVLSRYGADYFSQTEQFKNAFKRSSAAKYGVDHPMQSREIRMKSQHKYRFDGANFDSAPEMAVYVWLKDTGMKFEYQPDREFSFEYAGAVHKYFPDFKVNGEYWEIKGNQFLKEDGTWQCPYNHSMDGLYEAKRQCALKNKVKILYSQDYQKYLDYIDSKYGKNYLKQFKKRVNKI